MKTILKFIFLLLFILFLYLFFWPVSIQPKIWNPEPAPELKGKFQQNNKLSTVNVKYKGQCKACEDVAIDSAGAIYGGREDRKIMKFVKNSKKGIVFADTKGRPLGMDFDQKGNLIVADAYKGILSIDKKGNIKLLTDNYKGKKFGFPDDLEVAPDGIIYFTDASIKYPIKYYKNDVLEHGANGAFYSYNPKTGKTKKIIDSMYFANGVAVDPNGNFVLINETSAYRIRKYWLKGPKKGENEILIDNLPGFNDGISRGKNGIYWVALVSPRDSFLDKTMSYPFLRKVIARLPEAIKPKPQNYGFVLGIDKTGNIIYNLQDPTGKFAQISSVQQFGDSLYLGSLEYDGVGIYPLNK